MAHILILETLGNDMRMLETAVALGHEVTFFTGDLPPYLGGGQLADSLLGKLAQRVVEVTPFSYASLEEKALSIHREKPFSAVLCPLDTRLIAASRFAEKLGLRFLNPKSTELIRDKFNVRKHLAEFGISQPRFALAITADDIRKAVKEVGYPAIVKLADGFGSVGAMSLKSDDDLNPIVNHLPDANYDFGLGVFSNGRMLIEQYVQGHLIGCDVITENGKHIFLGIHDKSLFAPPYFGIRGSSFPTQRFDTESIKQFVFKILDALNFDWGASHTEILVTPDRRLYLVEVNPRLVGAHVARLVGHVYDRSIYADVLNLHLGNSVAELLEIRPKAFGASRWITAPKKGKIVSITLPDTNEPGIQAYQVFKKPGDHVRPPFHTGDRIGYVMTLGATQDEATELAERFIRNTQVVIE